MKRLILAILLISFIGLGMTGCASRVGNFTVLSTKNVEVSRVDLKKANLTRNVEGSDGRFWFLFIPFGTAPDVEEAVDEALELGRGDYMTSAVVYDTSWSCLLFSWGGYAVEGDIGNSLGEGTADLVHRPAPTTQPGPTGQQAPPK